MTLETGDLTMAAPVRMGQPGPAQNGHNRFGLKGRSKKFDSRIVAIRPDLADIAVAGEHFAPHYAAPMATSAIIPSAVMRASPSLNAPQISELLYGEAFALLDVTGGWAWGYSYADHHVGYIAIEALGSPIAPSHRVMANETILHSSADASSGGSAILPRGALLMGDVGADNNAQFLAVANGFVALSDVAEIDHWIADPAAIAEALVDAPYLAGGRTAKGMDAAGLVQLAWAAAGVSLPRTADLQLAAIGPENTITQADLKRGDLVFFPDHVAMMIDAENVIHASQHWQGVRRESLSDMIARSTEKHQDQPILAYKRLQ